MEAGDDPIEIELTPTDPRRPPTPRSASTTGDESGERSDRHLERSRRRRVAALVIGVGLGALVVGWVIGSDGGDDPVESDAAARDPPANAADEEAAERQGDLRGAADTLPAADFAPPTTAAAVPTIETTTIAVARELGDEPFELIGTTYGMTGPNRRGAVITLDARSGAMTVRRDTDLPSSSIASSEIWAGPGWALLAIQGDDSRTVLLEGDGAPVEVDVGLSSHLIAASTPGEFWRSAGRVRLGMPGDAQLVDRHGEPIGGPLTIAQSSRLADPAGGLVVVTTDGSYSVTVGGTDKIADGAVIALDADRALSRPCDDQLACGHVVVDRTTGDETSLELPELARTINFVPGGGDTNTIAPDGHTVALAWIDDTSPDPQVGLIDLDTGEVTRLTTSGDTALRWSPDGRFALYLDAGRLMARDLATGESFVVADDLPLLSGIAVRPSPADATAG